MGDAGIDDDNGPELAGCVGPPTALLVVLVIGFCDSKVLISLSSFSGFLVNICTFSEIPMGAAPYCSKSVATAFQSLSRP
jgi:hypothetical protein